MGEGGLAIMPLIVNGNHLCRVNLKDWNLVCSLYCLQMLQSVGLNFTVLIKTRGSNPLLSLHLISCY